MEMMKICTEIARKLSITFFILFLCFGTTGCSKKNYFGASNSAPTKLPENYKPHESISKDLSKAKLERMLKSSPELNRIRMVEVFRKGGVVPEYRLFEINQKGVYSYLGLEDRDVLVAADDFIIYDRNGFPKFVYLLPGEKQASILVRREDREIMYRYTISEP